jgi:predicted PurR-regulated permease PerM
MQETLRFARTWLTFAGSVLVVAVLYWAQAVVVPIALAILLTFLLTPIVTSLQRRIGRVPAVLAAVLLTSALLGAIGWATTRQLGLVVQELPAYRQNIRQKMRDIRTAGDGSVGAVNEAIENIRKEIEPAGPPTPPPQPVVIQDDQSSGPWRLPTAFGAVLEPLATIGLVVVLAIFMLLERQDLRDRLIRLFGHGRLTGATRAFDEAGRRVSRYLLTQSLINLAYGVGVGIGTAVLGVPYPVLWGFLAAILRFIPYVGPWAGAAAPILVALAVLEGWTRPMLVAVLFLVLELFTNMVLETIFYAGAAGISQVGLLVAVAFWTWLWGPLGLIMATPLTVCLAVLGRHVPGLGLVTTLLSDHPVLEAPLRFYQRLLAGDQEEAAEIVDAHLKSPAFISAYDAVVVPALAYAERDRMEGTLSLEEESAVVTAASELVEEVAATMGTPDRRAPAARERMRVLGWPARGDADVLALRILDHVLGPGPVTLDVLDRSLSTFEVIQLVRERACGAVCIADVPPCPPARARHLVKRLRAAQPDLKILVGRWGPDVLQDEEANQSLRVAGADHVGVAVHETAAELRQHADLATPPSNGRVRNVQARA